MCITIDSLNFKPKLFNAIDCQHHLIAISEEALSLNPLFEQALVIIEVLLQQLINLFDQLMHTS